MKKLLPILTFLVSTTLIAQPNLEWAAPQIGTTTGDASTSWAMHVDQFGNTITVGRFAGTVDFDPTPAVNNVTSGSSLDIYVSKVDPLGNLIWVKNFGSSSVDVNGVTGDDLGNIYLTGGFQNTNDFNPGVSIFNMTSNGGQDVYVLKLNSSGIFQWAVSVGNVNFDRGKAILYEQTSDQVLIAGDFSGTVDFDPSASTYALTSANSDGFLLSLSSAGAFQWTKQFSGAGGDYIEDIDSNGNGEIFITGHFSATIDVDPTAGYQGLTTVGQSDVFVCKLTNFGNLIWGSQIGGSVNSTRAWAVEVADDGSVFVGGDFNGTINFTDINNNTSTINTLGAFDMFVAKLNSTGGKIWAYGIGATGNDKVSDIHSRSGITYIGGYYSATTDIDPGPNTYQLPTAGSGTNACLFTLDNTAGLLWAYSFGNSGGGLNNDDITDVHVDDQGDVLATGYFTGTSATVDLDPGPGIVSAQGALGNNNAFTIKLGCLAVNGIDVVNATCSYTWIDGNTYYSDNNTATWMLSNQYGCDSLVTLNLTISDIVAPQADVSVLLDVISECEITTLTAPTATDNCAGAITGTHNATLPITSSTTITWTYDDGNGNTSTQTQNVIVDDVTAPVADLATLSNITSECFVTSLTAPTATDNCAGTITGTHNATLPITSSTTITWTYDDGNGNTSTQTQNVIIDDVTAPVPNMATLASINSECSVTSLTAPTATDNCAGTITGTHNATLPITTQGTTVVTWTYDDGNGNTSTQTQNVVINDATAPVANTGSLAPVNAECQVTSIPAPTATDNCAGTVTGTPNVSFPITTQGTFTITWTYNDGNGNTSTQTQSVTIDDATAPVPDNAILSTINEACSATPTAPTATDNCAGSITATPDVSFPITTQGTTVVTWTYDDGNGNTSTQTQNVIIDDATAPVADAATLADITSECEVTSLTPPTATDNCAGSVTGSHNVTLPITASGTTTVTWTYDDGNGNTSTQTQDVVITPIDNTVTQVDGITLSANASGYSYQWVDCDNGNAPIVGETSQTFVASANGSYAVIIDNGVCSVTSACIVINEVGIEESDKQSFIKVFPNPTKGMVTITTSEQVSGLRLMNALGQMVYESIDLQSMVFSIELPDATGVYFLQVEVNGGQQTLKIIKH